MKKILSFMAAAILAIPFMASCQKEEATVTVDGETVSKVVVKSFEKRYPTAQNVMWENKSPYWVAHFDMPATKAVAADPRTNSTWFDNNGNWQMSEHDIDYDLLPQEVRVAFEASSYAAWERDDVETLDREGVIELYMIEVEKTDEITGEEIEVELYWTAEGLLTREVPATEDHTDLIPDDLPSSVIEDLKARYGEFEPVEIELENGEFEVEVLVSGRIYELKYVGELLEWASTEYDILAEELPAELVDLLRNAVDNFDAFEFDEIEVTETSLGLSYEIELEISSEDQKLEIIINTKGEVTIK